MALDFTALQTELYARGFNYLNDAGAGTTRAKRWINEAMHEINDQEDWLFLQTTSTGTAPLTISDLDTVLSVYDSTQQRSLGRESAGDLVDRFGDLTTTGTPLFYYVTSNTLNVYPANTTDSLSVRYFKVQTDLSSGSDVPLMPDRYRQAIVEFAAAKAYIDSDNPDMAMVCRQVGQAIVDRMKQSQVDPQQFIVTSGDF